jgi:hypothetical protein
MLVSLSWGLALGLVVLTVLRNPKTSRALWASEESAHSTAAEKRQGLDTRRENRYASDLPATVSALGGAQRQSPCRVVNVSRSGLRLVSTREFAKGAQVHVQWGEQFFVGCVLYNSPGRKEKEYISGLELLSSNHTWYPFSRLRFWKRTGPTCN